METMVRIHPTTVTKAEALIMMTTTIMVLTGAAHRKVAETGATKVVLPKTREATGISKAKAIMVATVTR
jgi:hypothetical protein